MSDPLSKKPIDEVLELIKLLNADIQSIKKDISHMKTYVRKVEIREGMKDDLLDEYVKPKSKNDVAVSKGWFW